MINYHMEDKVIEKEDFLREIESIDPKALIKCINLAFPKWGKMITKTDEIYYYTGLVHLLMEFSKPVKKYVYGLQGGIS